MTARATVARVVAVVVMLVVATAHASSAATPEAPASDPRASTAPAGDVWGPVRLGMSPQQVRALKQFTWGESTAWDGWFGGHWITSFVARDPVMVYGLPAELSVDFKEGSADIIALSRVLGKGATAAQCEQAFLQLLRDAETTYGPFSPQQAPHARHMEGVASDAVTSEQTPHAASRFSRTMVYYLADVAVSLGAVRRVGSNIIQVGTGWSLRDGADTCKSGARLTIEPVDPSN
jgi:hypothetical protein